MAGYVRTVAPVLLDSSGKAAAPVSLQEVRDFLKLPDGSTLQDDSFLNREILAAYDRCEHVTGRAVITQTWTLKLDSFWGPSWDYTFGSTSGGNADFVYFDPRAGWVINFPLAPLAQVLSVQFVDGVGVTETLDPSLYIVDVASEPGRITPAFGKFWPVARRQANAVSISFKCGYGNDGTSVPEGIKDAIRHAAAYCFVHREDRDEDFLNHLFDRFQYGGT